MSVVTGPLELSPREKKLLRFILDDTVDRWSDELQSQKDYLIRSPSIRDPQVLADCSNALDGMITDVQTIRERLQDGGLRRLRPHQLRAVRQHRAQLHRRSRTHFR